MSARALVVAKAPVPGLAKTRLGARVGHPAAADLAAAALLDTLEACAVAFGADRCHLALAGDLADARRGEEIRSALRPWRVFAQQGDSLGDRLAHAHGTVAADHPGAVVQVGMDTPQVTPALLAGAAGRLGRGGIGRGVTGGGVTGRGVIGPADDGGWWLLGLSEPASADVLRAVPMSTPDTGTHTRRLLSAAGVRLDTAATLRDVDTVEDAAHVAARAPGTRFAEAWSRVAREVA